jgi:hypothetical protein
MTDRCGKRIRKLRIFFKKALATRSNELCTVKKTGRLSREKSSLGSGIGTFFYIIQKFGKKTYSKTGIPKL